MIKLRELNEALFPEKRPSLAEERELREESGRRIVALQSRGNLSFQKGNLLTESDLDAERQEVEKLNF